MLTTMIGSVYHIEGSIVNEVFRRLFTIIQHDITSPIMMVPLAPLQSHVGHSVKTSDNSTQYSY